MLAAILQAVDGLVKVLVFLAIYLAVTTIAVPLSLDLSELL